MILIDANILIYATDPRSERDEQARGRLDGQLNGDIRVGLPWQSLLAFIRVMTNPRVFERPRLGAHCGSCSPVHSRGVA